MTTHDATTGFHDIKTLPEFELDSWLWIFLSLAALAVLWLIFRPKKNVIGPTMVSSAGSVEDPLESLKKLTVSWNRGEVQPRDCAAQMSILLRCHLEKKAGFQAVDQTSHEVLLSLQRWAAERAFSTESSTDLKRRIERALRVSDRATFSDHPEAEIPRISEALESISSAMELVNSLTLPPTPQQEVQK